MNYGRFHSHNTRVIISQIDRKFKWIEEAFLEKCQFSCFKETNYRLVLYSEIKGFEANNTSL